MTAIMVRVSSVCPPCRERRPATREPPSQPRQFALTSAPRVGVYRRGKGRNSLNSLQ